MRQLFIYWKVPAPLAQAAFAAIRRAQASLRAAHPGLQAGLFRRSEAAPEPTAAATVPSGTAFSLSLVTGLESYALPGGIDPVLQARVLQAGDDALREFGAPQRHLEVFVEA